MSCCEKDRNAGNMPHSEVVKLGELVQYSDGSIVSRTLIDTGGGSVTLFAFDKGQSLSEHTAPFDALVQVIEGSLRLTIGGSDVIAGEGQSVLMPADVPHALNAEEQSKMLLVMIKSSNSC